MNEEEKEDLQIEANLAITTNGNTLEVKRFLQGCGLNLAIMKADGNEAVMDFEVAGTTLKLTLA